jgi:hypothetical protein
MTYLGASNKGGVFRGLLAVSVAALACAARADLVASSPFLPTNAQGRGAAAGPSGPIELRGIIPMSDGVSYLIYDVAKKKSVWVGLNESGHDFVVRSADPDNDTVTVDFQGRPLKLTLRVAKISSSGTASAAVGGTAAPSAVDSTVVVNPSAADEQKRLDAISEEVRRRRLMREQVMEKRQATGNVPPADPSR